MRVAGAVIGESKNAKELVETGYPPVIYFPRDAIAMALLDKTEKQTTCPHKGVASYFTIHTKNDAIEDICWSYEQPHDTVASIKGHIAFLPHDRVCVEKV